MDRIWQWAWDRYGARYSWAAMAVAFPVSLPVYLLWSFLIVAVEKSGHYVQAAAVTVVAALVLHCFGAIADHRRFRPAEQWRPATRSIERQHSRPFKVPGVGSSAEDVNHEAIQAVEMPAWNGIGTARSVAKLYGSVATGGSDLGMTTPTLDALTKPAEPPTDGLRDKVLHIDTTYSLGFVKPFPKWVFGSSEKAFGTAGAGGSFGFADPDTGIGFAYTMNRMGFHIWNDPRELALRNALFDDVLGTRPQT